MISRPISRGITEGIGGHSWRVESLFQFGDNGSLGDLSHKNSLFQDPAGEIRVEANGDPVGLIKDRSGSGNDAVQANMPSRPEYQSGALFFDLIDDQITIDLPAFVDGTLVLAGTSGTWVQKDVSHSGGAFSLGVMNATAAPAGLVSLIGRVVGWVVIDRSLADAEISNAIAYFQARGAHWEAVDPAIVGIHRRAADTLPAEWIRIRSDGLPLGDDWQAAIDANQTYAGITTEIIDDQHMVKIPKFWERTVDLPYDGVQYYQSSAARPGFRVHRGFFKAGVEVDHFHIGAYQASENESQVFESQPNVLPRVSLSGVTAIQRMEARNTGGETGWGSMTWHQICAIKLLCLIEIGTPDPREMIGPGWNSSTSNSGDGAELQPAGTGDANWRGIYDLYGNVHQLCTGIETRDGVIWVADENGDLVETEHEMPAANRYIGACYGGDLAWAFLPTDYGPTSSAAGYTAYAWRNDGTRAVRHGGSFINDPAHVGLFTFYGNHSLAGTNTNFGFRLAKV